MTNHAAGTLTHHGCAGVRNRRAGLTDGINVHHHH